MDQSRSERRKDPRAPAQLKVQLSGAPQSADALTVSTLNIGSGGVYVQVPRFIEPLTKLFLTLLVPGPTPEDEPVFVDTEAIVVRTLPEKPDAGVREYEIACAFLELRDEHRDVINRYVLSHRAGLPAS